MKKWMLGGFFVGVFGLCMSLYVSQETVQCQVNSNGEVDLVNNNSSTPPKDPTNPSNANDSGDSNNPPTNERGPLSLDVVPKGFYFGTQKMYHAAHNYYATGVDSHIQYLQVTDNRDAGTYGWSLRVRQDGYLRNEHSDYEIKGSTLILPMGETRNRNSNEGSSEITSELDSYGVEITNDEKIIFSASSDPSKKAGKSTSTNSWQSQEVMLTIPKNMVKEGEYSNKIYWILTDGGPTN